jgi:hypothetical protein
MMPAGPPVNIPSYKNVKQQNQYWCWAAVTCNVYNSLSSEVSETQCQLAMLVGLSCSSPSAFVLRIALADLKIWKAEYDNLTEFFEKICDQLTGGEPMCAEVHFGSANNYIVHFVAITGLDPVSQNVWVADPYLGGPAVEFTFAEFLSNYYFAAGTNGAVKVLQAVDQDSISRLKIFRAVRNF